MSDVPAVACDPQLYCCSRIVLLDLKQKILRLWFTAYLILVLGALFSCLYKQIYGKDMFKSGHCCAD
jgi:hypothetical protein